MQGMGRGQTGAAHECFISCRRNIESSKNAILYFLRGRVKTIS